MLLRVAVLAVLAALLLLWECLELEDGGGPEVAGHRVRAGGELREAVVSYALPLVGEEEADSIG